MMGRLWQDVKYGVRTLAKNPGFTATAVITLALAIGANTAVFSVVDPLLLRKLPVERPDELVQVRSAGSLLTEDYAEFSTYRVYRESGVFEDVAGFAPTEIIDVNVNGGAQKRKMEPVTGSYFSTVGTRPHIGRFIADVDDERSERSRVAVLSFRFWTEQFGADANVIGKTFFVHGAPCPIIGVAGPEFLGMVNDNPPDFYVPTESTSVFGVANAGQPFVQIVARLKPGLAMNQVTDQLAPFLERAKLQSRIPKVEIEQGMDRVVLTSLARGQSSYRERYGLGSEILLAIVGFILLIACANLANLLLARGVSRRRELAVRLALGASRGRLLRGLLTETALLIVAGTAAGGLCAVWANRGLIAALSTRHVQFALESRIDSRVLLFTVAIAVTAMLLAGIGPAIVPIREGLAGQMSAHQTDLTAGARSRFSKSMMVAQVAVSVSLLAAAAMLARSLVTLETMSVGFERSEVLAVSFEARSHLPERDVASFYSRIRDEVAHLPGVKSEALSALIPMQGAMVGINIAVDGHTLSAGENTHILFSRVSPGYFATVGMRMLAGRDFVESDTPGMASGTASVAIVNEAMARHYFGSESPLGKTFRTVEGNRGPIEIVGVVEDAKYNDMREQTPDYIYVPGTDIPRWIGAKLMVRVDGDARALVPPIRSLVAKINGDVGVSDIETLKEQIDESLHQDRLVAGLSGGFSLLALVLTAVGLFGVLSFSVARRTSEIGVRMALGARPADIFRLIVGNGMTLVVIGLVIGAGGAAAAGRLLRGMLFGVKGFDPVAMGSVVVVLGAAAFLACYLPARRASRVDPMRALRSE